MILATMVFVGGTLAVGGVKLWSAKTLADGGGSGVKFRLAEMGAIL